MRFDMKACLSLCVSLILVSCGNPNRSSTYSYAIHPHYAVRHQGYLPANTHNSKIGQQHEFFRKILTQNQFQAVVKDKTLDNCVLRFQPKSYQKTTWIMGDARLLDEYFHPKFALSGELSAFHTGSNHMFKGVVSSPTVCGASQFNVMGIAQDGRRYRLNLNFDPSCILPRACQALANQNAYVEFISML